MRCGVPIGSQQMETEPYPALFRALGGSKGTPYKYGVQLHIAERRSLLQANTREPIFLLS